MRGGKLRWIKNLPAGRLLSLMLRPIPRSFPGLRQFRFRRRTFFDRRFSGRRLGGWRNFRGTLEHGAALR